MANDEGTEPAEGAEQIQVGKGGKLPMIIAAVVALLLGAGGTFGAMQMMGGDDDGASGEKSSSDDGSKKVLTKMTTLGEFTVNLRASSSRTLQMEIQVETEMEIAGKVEERMPQIRDSVILLASDYSVTELEGIDGKLRLRDEIQARVNAVLEPAQVNRVYFTAFVVN